MIDFMELPFSQSIIVPAERSGQRADEFLFSQLPQLSRTRIKQKIQCGESLLNGRRYASSARLKAGDTIMVFLRHRCAESPPSAMLPPVLYEDDELLALDKPAGLAVHPSGGAQSDTLIQLVRHRYLGLIRAHLDAGDRSFYPSLVNRLDERTSGIVLVAKTRRMLTALHALIARREIEKRYIAVVTGCMEKDAGDIELAIGAATDGLVGIRMVVRPDGRSSQTGWEVVRRLAHHTILRVFPRTGRQHQIRVHLAAIGHPVWGDLLYADETMFQRYWQEGLQPGMPARHLLHAESVRFAHPLSGLSLQIESNPPEDFLSLTRALETDAQGRPPE